MKYSPILPLCAFIILLQHPVVPVTVASEDAERSRKEEVNSTETSGAVRRWTLMAPVGAAGDLKRGTVIDSGSKTDLTVAYLTVKSDLVFDGRLATVNVTSDDSDEGNDDHSQKTVIFDVWNIYKRPLADPMDRRLRQVSVTFDCSRRQRLRRVLRQLSDDYQTSSSSPSVRYRNWCEAGTDSRLADAMYVVFASVSTGEVNAGQTRKYLATGPPAPSTGKVQRLVDYYSQLRHGNRSAICWLNQWVRYTGKGVGRCGEHGNKIMVLSKTGDR